jgi:hypothetical protein
MIASEFRCCTPFAGTWYEHAQAFPPYRGGRCRPALHESVLSHDPQYAKRGAIISTSHLGTDKASRPFAAHTGRGGAKRPKGKSER